MGRPSLLPSQPYQSVPAFAERDQLHHRLPDGLRRSGEIGADRLAGVHGQPAVRSFLLRAEGYDEVNRATHKFKEDIKVGYNLRRKVILHAVWALSPALLWLDATFFGLFPPHANGAQFVRHVGEIWLIVGIGALLFRMVQLFFLKNVQTGLVWATKILTDPFNDAKIYWKAPFT